MISFFQQYPEYWSDWIARLLLGARVSAELSLTGFALAALLSGIRTLMTARCVTSGLERSERWGARITIC